MMLTTRKQDFQQENFNLGTSTSNDQKTSCGNFAHHYIREEKNIRYVAIGTTEMY